MRIVEREIRPAGLASVPYSYAVAGDAEIDRDLGEFRSMLITALAVLGLGRLVVATLFQVRFGLSPLRAIRHDLAAIRSGEAETLEGQPPDEIKPLQQELNALIQSNREIVDRARTHVGNLAHALKTPLSVITNEARRKQGSLAAKVIEQAEIMRTQIAHHLDRARVAARAGAIGDTTEVEGVLKALKRALDRIYDSRGARSQSEFKPRPQIPGREARLIGDGGEPARQRLQMGEVAGERERRTKAPAISSCSWTMTDQGLPRKSGREPCSEASVWTRPSQDRDSGSRSWPISHISIRGASSWTPRRKGACGRGSSCPRLDAIPYARKSTRLKSPFVKRRQRQFNST